MKVSLVIPTVNEVQSLDETLRIVIERNPETLHEVLVMVCDRTLKESLDVVEQYARRHPALVRVVRQDRPYLGGALMSGINQATGTHVVTMFSDLESDPELVRPLIEAARVHPEAIIQASRWKTESKFVGYGRAKLVLNAMAQGVVRTIFWTPVTDFTFGFRLYPRTLVQSLPVTEIRHGYVLESLLLALRLKVRVIELPCKWVKRPEAKSSINWRTYLHYLPLTLRLRFRKVVPGAVLPACDRGVA